MDVSSVSPSSGRMISCILLPPEEYISITRPRRIDSLPIFFISHYTHQYYVVHFGLRNTVVRRSGLFLHSAEPFISIPLTENDCDHLVDLGFVVDSSSSIGKANWDRMMRFLMSLTSKLNVNADRTHIGVVTFDAQARVEFDFQVVQDTDELNERLVGMTWHRGLKNTALGLQLASDRLFSYDHGMRSLAGKVRGFLKAQLHCVVSFSAACNATWNKRFVAVGEVRCFTVQRDLSNLPRFAPRMPGN